jgi:hypothetical protein
MLQTNIIREQKANYFNVYGARAVSLHPLYSAPRSNFLRALVDFTGFRSGEPRCIILANVYFFLL